MLRSWEVQCRNAQVQSLRRAVPWFLKDLSIEGSDVWSPRERKELSYAALLANARLEVSKRGRDSGLCRGEHS